jgi:hypothetical protein
MPAEKADLTVPLPRIGWHRQDNLRTVFPLDIEGG